MAPFYRKKNVLKVHPAWLDWVYPDCPDNIAISNQFLQQIFLGKINAQAPALLLRRCHIFLNKKSLEEVLGPGWFWDGHGSRCFGRSLKLNDVYQKTNVSDRCVFLCFVLVSISSCLTETIFKQNLFMHMSFWRGP